MAEIVSRLRQTESRAQVVIESLERQRAIHESLDDACTNLRVANSVFGELRQETERATEAFTNAVVALQQATEVLRRADPAVIASALELIDERTGRIEEKCGGLGERISDEQERVRRAVGAVAGDLVERLTPVIERQCKAAADIVFQKLRDHGDASRRQLSGDLTTAADRVVLEVKERLKPRNIWEGVAGRRKG